MNQNEPKWSNATHNQQKTIHDKFFLVMSTTKQTLVVLLLTEEALFTQAFRRWVSLFKYLQEFKAARRVRILKVHQWS